MPELPDGSYLMIKEFRYPINGVFAAFPAGLIDEGETIEETVDAKKQATAYEPMSTRQYNRLFNLVILQ